MLERERVEKVFLSLEWSSSKQALAAPFASLKSEASEEMDVVYSNIQMHEELRERLNHVWRHVRI